MSDDSSRPPDDASRAQEPAAEEETYRLSTPNPMGDGTTSPPTFSPPPRQNAKKVHAGSKRANMWALWSYNALVFITSVCVMTLELTASRLISKTVGSSLYTWTSVIGVVLAGITLGNWLGGWLADRYDRGRSLAWMYLLGSVSCASVLWLDQIIAPMSRPSMLSWPAWILTVVSAIFLLPSLALGTISPLVASMALSRSTKTGSTVGNVYAWGAFGSIVGTFLTGFYLMDMWGTRTIVGLTAGTLGLLAVIVAGAPRVFRVAVVFGWLQLLGWTVLAATATQPMMASVGSWAGVPWTVTQSREKALVTRRHWSEYGGSVGTKLHELGLLLRLRDDRVGDYLDESNYSTIVVGDYDMDGEPVKYLRLDKLIHSYYEPLDPTRLHYEYEQVYAAVTKRTARSRIQPVVLSTASLTQDPLDTSKLPPGVVFDEQTATLRIVEPSPAVFQALLDLAPDAPFWKAISELYTETNKPLWGGFSSVSLEQLPEGVSIPEDYAPTLRHDATLGVVTAYQAIPADLRDRLIHGTPAGEWHREVEKARGMSRKATALFMGGGGYIFPRWFLKEFPASPNLEVAELDPAVYRVVVEALGLTATEQKRIRTTLGDARNFVDDRLRENQRLVAAGKPPVRYDFIYGDAFNDFSIPAHLTTREFLQKVYDLLEDDGVFQANIIDIYPRTEYPGETVGEGEVDYTGPLPRGIAGTSLEYGRYDAAPRGFAPLEIKSLKNDQYRLRCMREITEVDESRLTNVRWPEPPVLLHHLVAVTTQRRLTDVRWSGLPVNAWGSGASANSQGFAWNAAILQLASQSRKKKPFLGTIPVQLEADKGALEGWTPGPAPFESIEVYHMGGGQYLLGFRGIVSDDLQQKLIDLDPRNLEWTKAVDEATQKSRLPGAGGFLGRYVATAAKVFPNIYVFSTSSAQPGNDRDTFVMVCSRQPLDLKDLADTGDWTGGPFAAIETKSGQTDPTLSGQMSAVLALAQGHLLTDDFAPVDNLLRPVFANQE